jgi:hypothetical protein
LIGSLTDQEDKHDSTKPIRTIDDIKIGDSVRLKMGISFTYGGDDDIGLEKKALIKLQAFPSALGEDSH